jgi:hypothetical protein
LKKAIPKRQVSLEDPRHLMRYLKAQAQGGTTQEAALAIAKSEGVSVDAVRRSIVSVESYRNMNSSLQMELAVRSIVIQNTPKLTATISSLLDATELVSVPNPNNGKQKIVLRADKTTRLEAGRLMKDLIIGLQPKGAPVEVNVNQTNQVANLSSAETTEERFARLRKQAEAHNLLPPEVSGVPQHIDRDQEDEDDEEEDDDEESDS